MSEKFDKELVRELRRKDEEKKMRNKTIIMSVIFIAFGAELLFYSDISPEIICYTFAIAAGIVGITYLISYFVKNVAGSYYQYDLVYGLMAMMIAVLMLIKKNEFLTMLTAIMGAMVAINGMIKLQHSIDMKRVDKKMSIYTGSWLYVLIFATLCIVFGSYMAFSTKAVDANTLKINGIAFIFSGITDIVSMFILSKKISDFRKNEDDKKPEKDAVQNEDAKSEDANSDGTESNDTELDDTKSEENQNQ